MLKDKRNIIIAVLILIVTIFFGILIEKVTENKQEGNNKQISQINEKIVSELSNNEVKDGMNQLGDVMKNKTNKSKIVVNGETITEKEIAYMDFVINNTVIHEKQEKKDATNEIIEEYIIAQDAKKKKIMFTNEENKIIEDRTKEQLAKDKEGIEDILNVFQMEYDEFFEFHMNKVKRLELETKWTLYISNAINDGEFYIEDEAFNKKCKEYIKSRDISHRTKLLRELIKEYKEYLKDKAVIEYINIDS